MKGQTTNYLFPPVRRGLDVNGNSHQRRTRHEARRYELIDEVVLGVDHLDLLVTIFLKLVEERFSKIVKDFVSEWPIKQRVKDICSICLSSLDLPSPLSPFGLKG